MYTERFILGEKKYISFEVKSREGKKDFIVRACEYELYKNGEIESYGEGEIDGHTISVLIEPKTAYKSYNLIVTYSIASQILKEAVPIEVIEP